MICASVQNKSVDECLAACSTADMAELRIDLAGFSADKVRLFIKKLGKPVLATCRHDISGLQAQKTLLEAAAEAGAAYMDLEIELPAEQMQHLASVAKKHGCKLIVSFHDYKATPATGELNSIIEACFSKGADIAKIAAMANTAADAARLMSLYATGKPIIALGMGKQGAITRVAAPLLGAEFTFGSASAQLATAPGQLTCAALSAIYQHISTANG
jgi:3-dehydroquinate dehydratase I